MYAVIDVGSNSVRMMVSDGVRAIYKLVNSTRLADGLAQSGILNDDAIKRSVAAVVEFVNLARNKHNIEPYIFATEAVRSAKNGSIFVEEIFERCGVKVDVIGGNEEALLGFVGVYEKGTVCVIDIGGASTEIVVGCSDGILYAKSIKIGAVRLRDNCGEDEYALKAYISKQILEYGNVPTSDEVVIIGGTASTVAAITLQLKEYDSTRVHNYILTEQNIINCYEKVRQTPLAERVNIDGLMPARADIIVGAIYELLLIMRMLGVKKVRVSESDNLEGYLKTKVITC